MCWILSYISNYYLTLAWIVAGSHTLWQFTYKCLSTTYWYRECFRVHIGAVWPLDLWISMPVRYRAMLYSLSNRSRVCCLPLFVILNTLLVARTYCWIFEFDSLLLLYLICSSLMDIFVFQTVSSIRNVKRSNV